MQPGFADQMRQSGQMGPPQIGGANAGPSMIGGAEAGPPMAPPPMGMEGPEQGGQEQIKQLLMAIVMLLQQQHNGGPPPGAPGMAGQSPGMPM